MSLFGKKEKTTLTIKELKEQLESYKASLQSEINENYELRAENAKLIKELDHYIYKATNLEWENMNCHEGINTLKKYVYLPNMSDKIYFTKEDMKIVTKEDSWAIDHIRRIQSGDDKIVIVNKKYKETHGNL